MRWFSDREIVVFASPEEFVFRGTADEVRFAPVLWLDADGKRIRAVGDTRPADPSLQRVDVFAPTRGDSGQLRARLLTMLLRHGLSAIVNKSVFALRPVVRFGSLAAFESLLSGLQRQLFQDTAIAAGARKVLFASE